MCSTGHGPWHGVAVAVAVAVALAVASNSGREDSIARGLGQAATGSCIGKMCRISQALSLG